MPRLEAPENGVVVRMYRQGHGDCFLLAMPRAGGGDPYYVLIDCGYKPGSEDVKYLQPERTIQDVIDHIHDATGGVLDLVILTHEHQDHLNGIWKKKNPYFEPFEIREAWLAWTEDPDHDLANELRRRHRDQILGLLEARRQLALAVGEDSPSVARLDALLGLELGGDVAGFDEKALLAAATNPEKSVNKQGIRLVKEKAAAHRGFSFLRPGGEPIALEGTAGIRGFVFGPPERADLIADEDPRENEAFPRHLAGTRGLSFSAALQAEAAATGRPGPFGRQYCIPTDKALKPKTFFADHYGKGEAGANDKSRVEATANAPWRRIDHDWLVSAENLALKLNTGINNTSLVVAFELPKSRKILFFAGDAQRGNWRSWADCTWKDGNETIDARSILARTVLYKVGHHGSHNATLKGEIADPHPNLSWMGHGAYGKEFTAMITAVEDWALHRNVPPWVHPLPSIRDALLRKAEGRVLQTDIDVPDRPSTVSTATWNKFLTRTTFGPLHFDIVIEDH